jgi:CBS domain-containing protein
MFHAKDIMTKEVSTVRQDAKINDVIRLLAQKRITGVPVVSDDMRLLGMVTEKDILRTLRYEQNIKGKTAADLMTREIISFDENDSLMEVFENLVENDFRRVPILSEGILVGIVSRRDIIEFFSAKAAGSKTKEGGSQDALCKNMVRLHLLLTS